LHFSKKNQIRRAAPTSAAPLQKYMNLPNFKFLVKIAKKKVLNLLKSLGSVRNPSCQKILKPPLARTHIKNFGGVLKARKIEKSAWRIGITTRVIFFPRTICPKIFTR
jgi:hypothetical protein